MQDDEIITQLENLFTRVNTKGEYLRIMKDKKASVYNFLGLALQAINTEFKTQIQAMEEEDKPATKI